jgi:hypothetical protein
MRASKSRSKKRLSALELFASSFGILAFHLERSSHSIAALRAARSVHIRIVGINMAARPHRKMRSHWLMARIGAEIEQIPAADKPASRTTMQ